MLVVVEVVLVVDVVLMAVEVVEVLPVVEEVVEVVLVAMEVVGCLDHWADRLVAVGPSLVAREEVAVPSPEGGPTAPDAATHFHSYTPTRPDTRGSPALHPTAALTGACDIRYWRCRWCGASWCADGSPIFQSERRSPHAPVVSCLRI